VSKYRCDMPMPPLLLTRSLTAQIVLAVALPIAYGLLTGWSLGQSAAAYAILSVLGILGGLGAGFDHLGADQGFVRGICGGLLFGVSILAAHGLTDTRAKASLPHPHVVLVVVTVVLGALLGAIGGGLRARSESRRAAVAAAL
jgi:hypothetical protein